MREEVSDRRKLEWVDSDLLISSGYILGLSWV